MEPVQISASDVVFWSIILSCRRSSLPRHRNQSPPMWYPTKYIQQTLTLPRYPSGLEHLRRQIPNSPPNFFNRSHGRSNYLQPTPQLPEIFSTDARAFKPGAGAPPGPSEILTPGLPPTRSLEALGIWLLETLYCIFSIYFWHAHHFH